MTSGEREASITGLYIEMAHIRVPWARLAYSESDLLFTENYSALPRFFYIEWLLNVQVQQLRGPMNRQREHGYVEEDGLFRFREYRYYS